MCTSKNRLIDEVKKTVTVEIFQGFGNYEEK